MQLSEKIILNIGCGKETLKEAINLDIKKRKGVDVVCDIRNGMPFPNERFKIVIADYILCQICEPEIFKNVMNDIWRVLEKNGVLALIVPNARKACAFQDPMDCRRFVKETFDYFNKDHYRYKVFKYGFKPWRILELKSEKNDRLYVEMQKYVPIKKDSSI